MSGVYLSSSFLYLNMGCHMLFVLKNRLQAQSIPQQRSLKILNQITSSVFKQNSIKTILIAQQPMSIPILKQLFRKLSQCSVMKLDNNSMQKLLFLIIMTIKKQFFQLSNPLQLFSLTLGNLKIMKSYINKLDSLPLVQNAINNFYNKASIFSPYQYFQIRQFLYSILQPYQTKVVNFQEGGSQSQEGKLIFIRRNNHNEIDIGKTVNHPYLNLDKPYTKCKKLSLHSWKIWQSSLNIDHVKDYQKKSLQRKINNTIISKQKSINQIFNINKQTLNDFDVKLDLFEKSQISEKQIKKQQKNENKKIQSKTKIISENIKHNINKQFQQINNKKEEQEDLLDLMDN